MQQIFQAAGKNIRMSIYEPADDASKPHAAVLLLHGAGGNVGYWVDRIGPMMAQAGLALYAPHYFDGTGHQRADAEALAQAANIDAWLGTVADALAWVAARPGVDVQRIAAVGVSLGAFLALSFAALRGADTEIEPAETLRCIVDISGGLTEPYAAVVHAGFPPTLIVHGESDTVVPVSYARKLDALLTDAGVEHETVLLEGEDHWFGSTAQVRLLGLVSSFFQRYLGL